MTKTLTSTQSFGRRLRREIEDRHLTVKEFAELADVSRITVHFWLRDEFRPRGNHRTSIAEALKVPRERVDEWLSAA